MKTLLNIIWFLFSGLWIGLGYAFAGVICFVLILTIPWGFACMRLAAYSFWPFGRTVVQRESAGVASSIGNVLWFIFAGIWLALGHIALGIVFFVTIIGIPFGIAHWKMVPVALTPLGREIVPSSEPYPRYRW